MNVKNIYILRDEYFKWKLKEIQFRMNTISICNFFFVKTRKS